MSVFSPNYGGAVPMDGNTFMQTPCGAVGFVQIAHVAQRPSSQIHLADGLLIKPDGNGVYTVRTSDLPPLLASGYDTMGAGSVQAFQDGVVVGHQGPGTAT